MDTTTLSRAHLTFGVLIMVYRPLLAYEIIFNHYTVCYSITKDKVTQIHEVSNIRGGIGTVQASTCLMFFCYEKHKITRLAFSSNSVFVFISIYNVISNEMYEA